MELTFTKSTKTVEWETPINSKSNVINMETTTIILTVLGSGTFSAVVTGFLNYSNSQRNKSIDFKYNYKKYILEKRKAAYDEVENLFLKEEVVFQNSIEFEILTTYRLRNRLKILDAMDSRISQSLSLWLSADLLNAVALYHRFVSLLINAVKNALTEEGYEPDYEIPEGPSVAIVAAEKELRSNCWPGIINAYMNDLIQLDNIDGYIKYIKDKVAQKNETNQ